MMQFSSRCKLRQATATLGDNDQESLSHEDIRKDLEGLNESANVDEEKRETTITLIQQKFIDSYKDTLDKMDIKTCQSLHDIVPDGTITWLQKPKLPKVKRGQQIAPEYFHQRSVGLWHPAKMYASKNNRMPCPYCNQKAHLGEPLVSVSGDDGFWAPNYREIASATGNWFLVARKYKCKKCNKEFRNTSEDVLRLCPADVRIRFGLTLTPRHGIETEVSQRLSQLWLKSPAWAAEAFNEAQVRNHYLYRLYAMRLQMPHQEAIFKRTAPQRGRSIFQMSLNMLCYRFVQEVIGSFFILIKGKRVLSFTTH